MERAEPDQNKPPDDTIGVGSSLELGNVKRVLSVKMETLESHYTSITPLGKGSFGEVHSAHDTLLGRDVAIKSLKDRFREEEEVVDRFLKEARGTSQLEHPNIMPVHEMGVNDDLGIFFTMKKIEGDDLKEILDQLEARTSLYLKKYPLNRLLEIFLAVCNGVAFAHSKGVIHRDLKPANIMIGEFGEVLILDWGLVKFLHDKEEGGGSHIQLRMEEFDTANNTLDGAISGTPNYMSPEQAAGRIDEINFQSDVYSLGSILYHILAHTPPFERTQLRKLLDNVKSGNFMPPRQRCPELKIPRELDAICMKAMACSSGNRYSSVETLAEDIRNYINHRDVTAYKAPGYIRFRNAMRRHPIKSSVAGAVLIALVLARIVQVSVLYGDYLGSMGDAQTHAEKAFALVDEAKGTVDALQKIEANEKLKETTPQERELAAELRPMLIDINKHFTLAIGYYEGIPDRFRSTGSAAKGYIEVIFEQISFALYRKDYDTAKQWLDMAVERHTDLGREFSAEAVVYTNQVHRQIEGFGSLRINAVPGMKEVVIRPYVENGSLLVKGDSEAYTEFPVEKKTQPKGSYLLEITLSNGQVLPYPIHVGHGEELSLMPDLPSEIPQQWAYVPGGSFLFGGPLSRFYRMHEIECDSFFISKTEVTVREYLEFWKSWKEPADKKAYMSRIRYSSRDREYTDAWDAGGTLPKTKPLSLDFPVVGITREAAEAFCEWKSVQLGQTVRLPTAQEWEKAARGVDGRSYVWGNGYIKDENLTLTKNNKAGKEIYPLWAPPGSFTNDISVYGAFDMAGNVREMTSSFLPGSPNLYQIKGGSASTPENFLPCSNSSDTPVAPSDVGFRYVMEPPD